MNKQMPEDAFEEYLDICIELYLEMVQDSSLEQLFDADADKTRT